jgi:carbon storage regulator
MLVLTRRIGESVQIGGCIEISILRINAEGQVQLGIAAPIEIVVLRKELLSRRKARAREQATPGAKHVLESPR